jgi:predicted O-linked N-acetylglucosamine transferase (SPINDLY family)
VYLYCTDAKKTDDQIMDGLQLDSYFAISNKKQKMDLHKEILADELDVLWYPEIGMDPLTTWLAAQRLVPVQFASWGHPITTGLKNIDYFLSGKLIEGVNSENHYREKLIRLPNVGCVTNFQNRVSKPGEWEKAFFPRNELTFLISQNPFKFHPKNDELLVQIAKAVPHGIFLIPTSRNYPGSVERVLERLQDKFNQYGVPFQGRFVTFSWMQNDEFLSLMERADIYLDLPTFSGYTTAWQGINCGIPIVTLEGEFMRQRLASGLLRKIGITDTIAQSFNDYVMIVQRLAVLRAKHSQWEDYRQKIKDSAPLADNDLSVVRAFEKFVLQVAK